MKFRPKFMNFSSCQILILIGLASHVTCNLDPPCGTIPKKPICTPNPKLVTDHLPRCCVEIDHYLRGRGSPGNFERPNNSFIPPWFNLELARRGQEVTSEFVLPILFSLVYGLLVQLSMPDIRDVLFFTGKVLDPLTQLRRDAGTFAQHQVWTADIWEKSPADDPFSNYMYSLAQVRKMHEGVEKAANLAYKRNGYLYDMDQMKNKSVDWDLWSEFRKDIEVSSIPMEQRALPPHLWKNISTTIFNQQAMGFVLYCLVGFPVLYPEALGIPACEEDLWAYNYLFAIFGYGLGIKNKYNVALHPDIKTARKFYKQLMQRYVIPALFHFDKPTFVLLDVVFHAIKMVTGKLITPRVLAYRFLTVLIQIEAKNLYESMSDVEQTTIVSLETALDAEFMKDPEVRGSMNRVSLKMIYAFGETQFPGRFTDYYNLSRHCLYA